jgi:hypothetical protein
VIAERRAEVYNSLDETLKSSYTEAYLERLYASFEASVSKSPVDLGPVTSAMTAAVLSKRPRARYAVGRGAGSLLALYAALPTWIADRLSSAFSLSVRDPLVSKIQP